MNSTNMIIRKVQINYKNNIHKLPNDGRNVKKQSIMFTYWSV